MAYYTDLSSPETYEAFTASDRGVSGFRMCRLGTAARRTKVLREISRPVFSLIESEPMSESCSYLSYDAVTALHSERNLPHLNDSVLEEYAEYAQDADF